MNQKFYSPLLGLTQQLPLDIPRPLNTRKKTKPKAHHHHNPAGTKRRRLAARKVLGIRNP